MNPSDDQAMSEEEAFSPDGVDLTLIHWFLKLTPAQRLALLQEYLNRTLPTLKSRSELQRDFWRQLRGRLGEEAAP